MIIIVLFLLSDLYILILCQENIIKGDCDLKPNTCFSVPSPPLNLRLNQLRQKQEGGKTVLLADIAWDPPENTHGKIMLYSVRYTLVGPTDLITSLRSRNLPIPKFATNVTTTTFCSSFNDALGFGKIYTFAVSAINTNMDIGLEAKKNITTRESAPEMYPVSIQFTGLNSKTVNISWQPPYPETQNGVIISYQISYFLYGQRNSSTKLISSNKEFVKVESLQENALYVFQIRACTNVGYGPWSPEFNFRTAVVLPDPPINIVAIRINNNQIKVTWGLPNTQTFVKIVGFRIYYCVDMNYPDSSFIKTNPMDQCQTLDVGPITMATIGELKFNTKYKIGLKSRGIDNRFGALSPMVEAPISSTPQMLDMAVKDLSCSPKSESIQIRWSQPDVIDSLTQFVISIKSYKSFINEKGKREESTRSYNKREVDYDKGFSKFVIDLKDMIPNTVYDISVQTKYELTSKSSFQFPVQNTSCRTLMSKPATVANPQVISLHKNNMSMSVLIYRVSEQFGIIKRYYLIGDIFNAKKPTTDRKYSLESLKSSTTIGKSQPFLIVEFSSEYFGGNSSAIITTSNSIPTVLPTNLNFDRILYRQVNFKPTDIYTIFARACIYNELYGASLSPSGINLLQSEVDSASFCTDSQWSGPINFSRPPPSTENVKTNLIKQSSVFTTAIIALIIGLGVFAIVSIAVGCFFKRRRVKRYFNGPQELIMNGDPSLKQALISQNNSAPPAYVPISHSNGVIEADSTLKSNYKPNRGPVTNDIDLIPTGNHLSCTPIPASHLAEYVATLKLNDNAKFTEEYESIEPVSGTGPQYSWNHSNLEVNKPKNRYANVIAYDHSRVILSSINDQPGSDYINANYCDGYRRQNAYIATQGPLPETFESFWRMVWENRSSIIVMMTRLEERQRVKCDQYWPNRGSDNYPNVGLTVTHLETVELAYYTLRKFCLSRIGGRETRDVLQCQFTGWPDPGCPSAEIILPLTILMFVRRVSRSGMIGGGSVHGTGGVVGGVSTEEQPGSQHGSERGPIVVHCSAGVGRTGVYIALDWQLARLQLERSVDVRGCVRQLRSHRNYMLQTEEQYRLVYEALLQAVLANATGPHLTTGPGAASVPLSTSGGGGGEVPLRHLHAHVTRLQQPLPVLGATALMATGHPHQHHHPQIVQPQQFSTGMEIEFNHLSELCNQRQRQFTSASLPENRLKNRLINILPYENNRVCLQPLRNQDGSDYINASFVDGYRQQKAYIATQGPLANTISDFWRMLWQHNSSIIVMLTQLREMGREKCSQYWPTDRAVTFGHIVVEPMVEYNMPSFILREFRVRCNDPDLVANTSASHSTNPGSPLTSGHRTVRQFQFLDWPEQGVPRSGEGLIDFIGQVHKTKEQFGQEGPITVHCSAGVGRTGVFLALSIVLDRMRSEGTIDLFQTVRLLRMQRPCMVQTEDQYQFCYLTALEYLSSFDQFLS